MSNEELLDEPACVPGVRCDHADTPCPAGTERCECGACTSDNWFDRTICACGAMHTCCSHCGRALDDCDYEAGEGTG